MYFYMKNESIGMVETGYPLTFVDVTVVLVVTIQALVLLEKPQWRNEVSICISKGIVRFAY